MTGGIKHSRGVARRNINQSRATAEGPGLASGPHPHRRRCRRRGGGGAHLLPCGTGFATCTLQACSCHPCMAAAVMGGSEVTKLLKPACLPLYKCDI